MKYLCLLWLVLNVAGCGVSEDAGIRKLGNTEFSSDKWAHASQVDRGAMVNSFLKKHDVTQMTAKEVRDLLGDSTAYYEYDEFPAYLVGPETVDSQYGKGYVLAFPIDRDSGLIRKYVIDPPIKSD